MRTPNETRMLNDLAFLKMFKTVVTLVHVMIESHVLFKIIGEKELGSHVGFLS